jgi:hypothetical protein
MSDYESPNSNLLLTKTNSIVGIKLTEFPQYKSALPQNVKFQMSKMDSIQLPNVLTKDVNNSLQTIESISQNNMLFKTQHGF